MQEIAQSFSTLLEEMYRTSSRSHKRIAKWLLDNRTLAPELSLDELAHVTGSSRSTVVRFCKVLGLDGYRDLKRMLVRPLVQSVGRFDEDGVVRQTLQLTEEAVAETFLNLDYDGYQQAIQLCAVAPYLLWFGSTESGALAQCGSHKCALLGMKSRVFIDHGSFVAQSTLVNPTDVFVAISWGGDGDHLRRPVLQAKSLGLPIVGITAERFSWLTEVATVSLLAGKKYVSYQGRQVTIRAGQEALINTLVLETAKARGINWILR